MLLRLGQLRDLSPVSEVGLAKENVDGEHEAVVVVLVNILCEECLLLARGSNRLSISTRGKLSL